MECEAQSGPSIKRRNVTWSEKMDNVLIASLFEDALIGGRHKDSTWKTETLKRATKAVEKVSPFSLKNDNIRSRLKTLRAHWMIVNEAASQSGFTFNYTTNLIEAEDIAWVEYVKSHPTAAHVREKPMKYFTELSQIFSKDSATGESQFVANDQASPVARRNGENIESMDEDGFIDLMGLGDPFADVNMSNAASADTPPTQTSGSKRSNNAGPSKRGKKSRRGSLDGDVMVTTCQALESAAKEIAGCFKGPDFASLDAELEAIEGLTGRQVTQALEMLSTNKDWIPMFLGMRQARRGEWIRMKLGLE